MNNNWKDIKFGLQKVFTQSFPDEKERLAAQIHFLRVIATLFDMFFSGDEDLTKAYQALLGSSPLTTPSSNQSRSHNARSQTAGNNGSESTPQQHNRNNQFPMNGFPFSFELPTNMSSFMNIAESFIPSGTPPSTSRTFNVNQDEFNNLFSLWNMFNQNMDSSSSSQESSDRIPPSESPPQNQQH